MQHRECVVLMLMLILYKILGFYHEESHYSLLGYNTVQSGRVGTNGPYKCWHPPTRLHGAIM
jgi:hypothetical protein